MLLMNLHFGQLVQLLGLDSDKFAQGQNMWRSYAALMRQGHDICHA